MAALLGVVFDYHDPFESWTPPPRVARTLVLRSGVHVPLPAGFTYWEVPEKERPHLVAILRGDPRNPRSFVVLDAAGTPPEVTRWEVAHEDRPAFRRLAQTWQALPRPTLPATPAPGEIWQHSLAPYDVRSLPFDIYSRRSPGSVPIVTDFRGIDVTLPPGFAFGGALVEGVTLLDEQGNVVSEGFSGSVDWVRVYTSESGYTRYRSSATWDPENRRLVFSELDPQDKDTLRRLERDMRGDAD